MYSRLSGIVALFPHSITAFEKSNKKTKNKKNTHTHTITQGRKLVFYCISTIIDYLAGEE